MFDYEQSWTLQDWSPPDAGLAIPALESTDAFVSFCRNTKKSGVSYDWQNCSLLCFATGAGAGAGAGASAWPGLIFQWLIIMIWATIQDVFCERKCSLFEIWPWLWQQPQWKSGIWAFWHASRAEQWSQGLWIIPRARGQAPGRVSLPCRAFPNNASSSGLNSAFSFSMWKSSWFWVALLISVCLSRPSNTFIWDSFWAACRPWKHAVRMNAKSANVFINEWNRV